MTYNKVPRNRSNTDEWRFIRRASVEFQKRYGSFFAMREAMRPYNCYIFEDFCYNIVHYLEIAEYLPQSGEPSIRDYADCFLCYWSKNDIS